MTKSAVADLASREVIKPARKVVSLRASYETQRMLKDWADANGFDLGWSYNGWPQHPDWFDFHVTIVVSTNKVALQDEYRPIRKIELEPKDYAVLGDDRKVPVLLLSADKTLSAYRDFFVDGVGLDPNFPDFKPHVSLSYRWSGDPEIKDYAPALPGPLVFDALIVSTLDDGKPQTRDAAQGDCSIAVMTDRAEITGTRITRDGYLVTDARVARTGIQQYAGHEVGRPDLSVVNVYRPDDEVFSRDSLASFAHRPVTIDHPAEGVTADNWKQLAVGNIGNEIVRDGRHVRVPMVLMDKAAIDHVQGGTREISMGYACRLEFADGVTPEGEAYQAIQRDIRINHAAIVPKGRAGATCRIGDRASPAPSVQRQPDTIMKGSDMSNLRKITVDGLTIEATDQSVQVIEKLQAQIAARDATAQKAAKDLSDAADALAEYKKTKDKEITDLKAQIPTADQLEAMLASRTALVDAAKKLAPELDCAKMSAADVRKAVVSKHLGDGAVKDRTPEQITVQFDTLAAMLSKASDAADPVRNAIMSGPLSTGDVDGARNKYLADTAKAWAA